MSSRRADGWHAFHIFYHADRTRLIRELVGPLAADLVASGKVNRFFYVRYGFGGPHVRFRVEVRPEEATAVARSVGTAAAEFFSRAPSTETCTVEQIRAENARILTDDRSAGDPETVFPDNSVVEQPFHLEVDRYGGPERVEDSLDFFTVSTIASMWFLDAHADAAGARRTGAVGRLLLELARDLADAPGEVVRLAGYAVAIMGDRMPALLPLADAAFERTRAPMCDLARRVLAVPASVGDSTLLGRAARGLASRIRDAPDAVRWRIATSQMHMLTNRLGLLNGEEVYLCRILARALEAVAGEDPDVRRNVRIAHRETVTVPPLAETVHTALAAFTIARGVRAGSQA